jgi:hypothetical protein
MLGRAGFLVMIREATAATIGEENDVPLTAPCVPSILVTTIPFPGAVKSTEVPQLEKSARLPLESIAETKLM